MGKTAKRVQFVDEQEEPCGDITAATAAAASETETRLELRVENTSPSTSPSGLTATTTSSCESQTCQDQYYHIQGTCSCFSSPESTALTMRSQCVHQPQRKVRRSPLGCATNHSCSSDGELKNTRSATRKTPDDIAPCDSCGMGTMYMYHTCKKKRIRPPGVRLR